MSSLLQQIKSLDANKQNSLTAGTNITIDANNVISSSGGEGGEVTQADLDLKQDVITTATNINLNTLNTVSDVSVGGNLSVCGIDLDTKIATATSGKQDTLTAGDNITIDANNVISSTATGGVGVSRIHFNATRSGSAYNINYNILLPYNVATLNVGSGYDTSTFTFTVPEAGTYLFFSNMLSNGGNKFQVNMIHTDGVNETVIQQVRKDNTFNLGLSSYGATTIKECNVGDEVFLRHLSGAVFILGPISTFGGYLIG